MSFEFVRPESEGEGPHHPDVPLSCRPSLQCVEFGEGSVTGDMCEDLCVDGLVEYKRCLYYENGKKVIEARWRGNPVILKSKLENFSSYEPLGILDYQVPSPPTSCHVMRRSRPPTGGESVTVPVLSSPLN